MIEERVNASSELMSWVEGCILLESPGLIVLNKPPGIPVHSGTDHSLGIKKSLGKCAMHLASSWFIAWTRGPQVVCLLPKSAPYFVLFNKSFAVDVVKNYFVLVKVGGLMVGVW